MHPVHDYERAKRELLRRIRRNRHRIGGRVHAIHRRGLRWLFWGECAHWVWRQLRDLWADSDPSRPLDDGGDHGRA